MQSKLVKLYIYKNMTMLIYNRSTYVTIIAYKEEQGRDFGTLK